MSRPWAPCWSKQIPSSDALNCLLQDLRNCDALLMLPFLVYHTWVTTVQPLQVSFELWRDSPDFMLLAEGKPALAHLLCRLGQQHTSMASHAPWVSCGPERECQSCLQQACLLPKASDASNDSTTKSEGPTVWLCWLPDIFMAGACQFHQHRSLDSFESRCTHPLWSWLCAKAESSSWRHGALACLL